MLLTVAVLATAGCGQSSVSSPPDTGGRPVTTGPASAGVATGNDAPSLGSGQATVTGTVAGPQGPAPGATVEIRRVANGVAARATITSGPGGAWGVRGVPGGSYSVRAWLAPGLAQTSPTRFFLAAQGSHVVALAMTSFATPLVQAAIAPDPPVTGQEAQVVVQITDHQVRSDGSVGNQAAEGLSVRLDGRGAWVIPAANPASTDSSGQATWTVTCEQPGSHPLDADLGAGPVPLDLSACQEAPATTTTTPPLPTTSLPTPLPTRPSPPPTTASPGPLPTAPSPSVGP